MDYVTHSHIGKIIPSLATNIVYANGLSSIIVFGEEAFLK
ncbi:hypothetical protein Shell_0886 [Staphylothermus hellenicus DSM 12710]|uniref:Uncharacterized protein n=1 Tax=Staphylothermus hellenicus (strain DSM 12710 / JCM 10830 / BK20S6-10-b1 / P8) TaxID=591019 RepID=D7D899_STAHD|nr:hypothetical protein Shell_0886 [Staphylothermus hellenicus DSM 12710]